MIVANRSVILYFDDFLWQQEISILETQFNQQLELRGPESSFGHHIR